MDSRLLPQNKASFGSNQLSKFRHFAQKRVPTIRSLLSRMEGTIMMRRPKRTNWHSKTAGGWPETAFHCCSVVLPHTRGRPVSWVAHRQLGSCLPPIRHLLKLIHRRVLINSCWLLGSQMASMEERERYRERDKRRKREIELLCKEGGGFMTGDCSPRTLTVKCSRY